MGNFAHDVTPSPRRVVRYQPILQRLKGLLYLSTSIRASTIWVPTLANAQASDRFPCVEAVLGAGQAIHDCVVTMTNDRGRDIQFLISYRTEHSPSRNRSLRDLCPHSGWEGSLLVLKVGNRTSFTGLTAGDSTSVDIAIARFLEVIDSADMDSPNPLPYLDI